MQNRATWDPMFARPIQLGMEQKPKMVPPLQRWSLELLVWVGIVT